MLVFVDIRAVFEANTNRVRLFFGKNEVYIEGVLL